MSWYRNKEVNGEKYKYKITNYRDSDGKPKQHSEYIGKVKGDDKREGDHKSEHQDSTKRMSVGFKFFED